LAFIGDMFLILAPSRGFLGSAKGRI